MLADVYTYYLCDHPSVNIISTGDAEDQAEQLHAELIVRSHKGDEVEYRVLNCNSPGVIRK